MLKLHLDVDLGVRSGWQGVAGPSTSPTYHKREFREGGSRGISGLLHFGEAFHVFVNQRDNINSKWKSTSIRSKW